MLSEGKNITRRNLETRIHTQSSETPKILVHENQNRNVLNINLIEFLALIYKLIWQKIGKDIYLFWEFKIHSKASIALCKLDKLCTVKG